MRRDTYLLLRKIAAEAESLEPSKKYPGVYVNPQKGFPSEITQTFAYGKPLKERWGKSYKPFGGSQEDYAHSPTRGYTFRGIKVPTKISYNPLKVDTDPVAVEDLRSKILAFESYRDRNSTYGAATAPVATPAVPSPQYDRFTYDLVRQLGVTENGNSIHIPVRPDGSLDMSGDSWFHPSMGIRTEGKAPYSSAVGISQVTGPSYLQYAKDGYFPATWWISDPSKIGEFYNLALDMRPDDSKQKNAQAGVNSIGKAIQQWEQLYGPDSTGPYAKYILGIHTGTGVKRGEDSGLPLQFYRDTYNMQLKILSARAAAIRKRFPGISDDELANRLALFWHLGEVGSGYLKPSYSQDPQAVRYLEQFWQARDQINNYQGR